MTLLCVSACAPTPARIEFRDSACSWARMIRPTETDVKVMSRGLVEDILVHNDEYKRNCMKDVK